MNRHCMKSFRIGSFSGPRFPAFGLNTEKYTVYLRIYLKSGEMRTRTTPITDAFNTVRLICKICDCELLISDRISFQVRLCCLN